MGQKAYPYVHAMVNEGMLSYDELEGNLDTDITGCQSFFRNAQFATFAKIVYRMRTLTVRQVFQISAT